MLNWSLLTTRNILAIGAIVLLTRLVFYKAINSLDGRAAPPTDSN